jgi:hypothetical protein
MSRFKVFLKSFEKQNFFDIVCLSRRKMEDEKNASHITSQLIYISIAHYLIVEPALSKQLSNMTTALT